MPWQKRFDVNRVRQQAMQEFWARGYEATSMHLIDRMGINRGSFYDTFKSKHQVCSARFCLTVCRQPSG